MSILSKSSLFDGVAGWCSGAAGVICLQPVDTILTRRQAAGTAALVMDSISRPSLLWRGSWSMISAVPIQNALLMAGYGWGKRSDSNWGVFVGGCTGGVLQSFLMSPVELLKVHQQVHAAQPLGAILRTTGLSLASPVALSKGLGATLLRDGLPHGIWFVSYELCKEYMLSKQSSPKKSDGEDGDASSSSSSTNYETFTVPIASGAVAATVAWGVGYPADLIKTRIQASSMPHQGIWVTTQELLREPGGLYRGFGLKLVRAVPASMIGFCVYERVSKQLFAKFGEA